MTFRIITVNENENNKQGNSEISYRTPEYLFKCGMCLCDNCGRLHSIDYAFCNDCFRKIFIDVDRTPKTLDETIQEVKKHRNKES